MIAICGRPNVGKSTLFNRLLGKSRAIVHDQEGITRDRFIEEINWDGRRFDLVDTGGITDVAPDSISKKMQLQVEAALQEAVLILFVVDGQQELTRTDYEVRDRLYRLGKPTILVVNKLDNPKMQDRQSEFYELGLGEPIAVSSGHGLGMDALRDAMAPYLPEADAVEEDAEEAPSVIEVAIVGKPNVGKSSFVNAILNEERTIVDATPGTTREAIDVDFVWKDQHYVLIDTAGMRRKAGIYEPVERFSVTRSLRAVRRADVCLLLIDAIEGITEQDKRIIGYTQEQGTPLVLVWTKWDLVEDPEKRFKALDDEIDLNMPHIKHVPYVTISNLTRQRIFKVFEFVNQVATEAKRRIATAELNNALEDIVAKNPPRLVQGRPGKIRYMTQASVQPTVFVLFVNQKKLFHFSYLRYLENQLRERYGFQGVPIKLELREGKPRDAD
jgi:GTP-binding protein